MAKYKCTVCQATFDVPEGQNPTCPACGASGSKLEKIK